ncbi:MAG: histidine kinase N-terminal 7TM domain-containing protein [Chloroflexota bacterium]
MAGYQFATFSILQFIAAAFAAAISYLAWRRRSVPGSLHLTVLMLAVTGWALVYGFENASTTIVQSFFWANAAYPFIHSIPPLFFLLVMEYSQRREWLNWSKLIFIWVMPIYTVYLVFTNGNHHLIWQSVTPNPNPGNLLIYEHGLMFWVGVTYGYILLMVAAGFLIREAVQTEGDYRIQAITLIFSIFPPLIANLLFIFNVSPFPGKELTPISFVVTGAFLGWGMLRHRLFELTPTAHRKLVDTMPDAVFMVDNRSQIGYINPAAQAVIQISAKQALGMPARLILAHWPYLERRFQEGAESLTEVRTIPSIDGHIYDLRISEVVGRRGSYKQGYLLILRDITERKELEKGLRDSEILYRNVTTNANDGIAIVQDNIIIYSNPQLAKLMGREIEAVENTDFSKFIAPSDTEKVQDRHTRRMRGEETLTQYRTALLHKTGQIIPVEFSISSMTLNDQPCILAMVRDISKTIAAEDEINRLASVVKQASESVIITDKKGDIVYVNPQFEKISGYTFYDVQGKNPRIIKSNHHSPDFYKRLWGTITSGETWEGVIINKHKDGQLSHEATTMFAIRNQANEITHYASVRRDITAQIEAEESLKAYALRQKQLNELTQATIEPLEFQETLKTLSLHLCELGAADACFITLLDPNSPKKQISAHHNAETQKTTIQPAPPECIDLTEKCLDTGQPMIVDNIHLDLDVSTDLSTNLGAHTVLALPLAVDHDNLGSAILTFDNHHAHSEEEIELYQRASQQVALALFKAELLETAERRAEESETLYLAGRAVTASLNFNDAIEHILNELNRVVPHDSASVQLIHGQEVEIIGQRGFPKENSPIGFKFSINTNTPNAIVFTTRRPYILEDAPLEYKTFLEPPHNHIRGWLGVPLLVRDKMIGLLALDSIKPGQFTKNHARLANAFASQVAIVLENARLYEETHRLAITDSLTNTFNRRHFLTLATREYERACRYQRPLSLIMMDLDRFKEINDTYGHIVGDQVLQTITKICKENLRDTDIIGRYGGEEFTILLPETPGRKHGDTESINSAEAVSERLRYMIENTPIKTVNNMINITVSIGIAELHSDCDSIQTLIDYADQALYQAKRSGRNQVVLWTSINDS